MPKRAQDDLGSPAHNTRRKSLGSTPLVKSLMKHDMTATAIVNVFSEAPSLPRSLSRSTLPEAPVIKMEVGGQVKVHRMLTFMHKKSSTKFLNEMYEKAFNLDATGLDAYNQCLELDKHMTKGHEHCAKEIQCARVMIDHLSKYCHAMEQKQMEFLTVKHYLTDMMDGFKGIVSRVEEFASRHAKDEEVIAGTERIDALTKQLAAAQAEVKKTAAINRSLRNQNYQTMKELLKIKK